MFIRRLCILRSGRCRIFKGKMAFSNYATKQIGAFGTFDYRLFFVKGGHGPISPVHDIPLWVDKQKGIVNSFIEIPRGTQPKLEAHKTEPLNPIWQDTKNNKLRYVAYPFPYNYGALPQTWENPQIVHPDTNAKGDNDPIDLCEIGTKLHHTGDLVQVKILGGYAMIDEGETDWKVIAIDVTDPLAEKLNDAGDIDKVFPQKSREIFEFLRDYKVPDGKPQSKFGFGGKLLDKKFMIEVIEETHTEWAKLVSGKVKGNYGIACTTLKHPDAVEVLSQEQAEKVIVEYTLKILRSVPKN
jgi:inorganic pyrophosphatase